jgi:PAS domain S-box-containing protein
MKDLADLAFTQSDHAINITDPTGTLIRVNRAYLDLYKFDTEDEVLGKTQRILRSPLTPDSLYQEMWSTISAGRVWRGELTNRAKDGSEVYIHLTISPIQIGGKIAGYMGFSIDRAQQVVLERQLFHANKLVVLGTLGAGLAHELNNPLASILLDAEYLKEIHAAPAAKVDHASALAAAESVIRGAERMRRVLEHLLLYSKNDGGSANSALSIRQLLDDSFLFIERQLVSRGIDIRLDVQGDPYVNGNRTQLESVIHNLLSNSRDAFSSSSKAKGAKFISIAARYEAKEGIAVIEYRDNAGGIPQDVIGRIFEPFFTTKGGEGTGLGLPISRKIVTDLGGSIHCESGDGETRFRILLPAFLIRPEGELGSITSTTPAAAARKSAIGD